MIFRPSCATSARPSFDFRPLDRRRRRRRRRTATSRAPRGGAGAELSVAVDRLARRVVSSKQHAPFVHLSPPPGSKILARRGPRLSSLVKGGRKERVHPHADFRRETVSFPGVKKTTIGGKIRNNSASVRLCDCERAVQMSMTDALIGGIM